MVGRREQSDSRGVAGDDRLGRDVLDREVAVAQILAELIGDERFPVDVVGIRQDGAHAARLDLTPGVVGAIPGRIERFDTAIFLLQPAAKFADCILAEAEFRIGNVGRVGPVDHVGLAPQVPTGERRAAANPIGERRVERQVRLTDAGMIEAVAGRRFGNHRRAVRGDEIASPDICTPSQRGAESI